MAPDDRIELLERTLALGLRLPRSTDNPTVVIEMMRSHQVRHDVSLVSPGAQFIVLNL